jgi:hypothetical protein
MKRIRYTLLADGSSDQALLHLINWALRRREVRIERGIWAELSLLPNPPKTLSDRIAQAMDLYPCDILFVHRDAEAEPLTNRIEEIRAAMIDRQDRYVPVIPIRMTEAWLLHDEYAIRTASGNPNGKIALELPRLAEVEQLANPKEILSQVLLKATELKGRRLEKRKRTLPSMRARTAELIEDYTALIGVPAFDQFLETLHKTLEENRRQKSEK